MISLHKFLIRRKVQKSESKTEDDISDNQEQVSTCLLFCVLLFVSQCSTVTFDVSTAYCKASPLLGDKAEVQGHNFTIIQ